MLLSILYLVPCSEMGELFHSVGEWLSDKVALG